MKKITITFGVVIKIETQKKAFEEIGLGNLETGKKVLSPDGEIIVVEGVGFGFGPEENTKVIWCSTINGFFYFYPTFHSLSTI